MDGRGLGFMGPLETRWDVLDVRHVIFFGDGEIAKVDAEGFVHCMCVGSYDHDACFFVLNGCFLDEGL